MMHDASVGVNDDSSEPSATSLEGVLDGLLIDGVACRGARAMLGISQNDLCFKAECSRKLLNDYENGHRNPHKRNIERIRVALEASGATFLAVDGKVAVMVDPARASSRTARGRTIGEK